MKRITFFIALFLFVSQLQYAQTKEWSIVNTYEIPNGASGLAWDGTYIYFGIYGADGNAIYQLDPADGSYSLYCNGPHEDAYGLTHDGTYLWTTDHPGSSSTPAIAIQMDQSGTNISQFDLPAHYMSGIAYDNGDFWVAAYYNPDGQIYKVDNAGNILKEFPAPNEQPWDLAMGNNCLWMADYYGDAIYQIDTADGSLINSYASEGVDPSGVVFDGAFLWYCDEGSGTNDYLYKVDLSGSGTPVINIPTTNYNFGVVSIGSSETWNMLINNVGTTDLEVTNVIIPNAVPLSTNVSFPLSVSPTTTITIPIEFTPTEFLNLNTVITVQSSDPINSDVDVTITGNGVLNGAAITLLNNNHDFGQVRKHAYTRWLAPIENIGNEVIIVDDIQVSDENFVVDQNIEFPFNIALLETYNLALWYNPGDDASDNAEVYIYSNNSLQNPDTVFLQGSSDDSEWPLGTELWQYNISGSYDVSPKGIIAIPDVNGDGINDVVIATEDATYRCFNGNSHGTADLLWENSINGSIFHQNAIQIIEDINNDGFDDVIVGTAWGDRSVIAISGKTGENIWKYDTHVFGDGGWVYQVDASYDYNNDGRNDVLASSGDDGSGTGPKRVHCLNSTDGAVIWDFQSAGAVYSVIGVEDFTGDGIADVIAGSTNDDETQGTYFGLSGSDGSQVWINTTGGSSVWALKQLSDINDDGIKDIIAGDFGASNGGNTYYVEPTTGNVLESGYVSNASIVLGFESMDDVTDDGKDDILPSHTGSQIVVLDGANATNAWSFTVTSPDKPWCSRVVEDITGDGLNDVVAGTLFDANEIFFLDGVYGTELETISYGEPIDALNVIADITQEGSMEVIAGGREGKIICYSGGNLSAYPIIEAPLDYNFGEVTYGTTATWNMSVTNSGSAQLKINDIEAFEFGEYFYTTASLPILIDAGGTYDIPIVFNASGLDFYCVDTLGITSNDPTNPEVLVEVQAAIPDGIEKNNLNRAFAMYPNPVKENLVIEAQNQDIAFAQITIHNPYGQAVFADNINLSAENKYIWPCLDSNGERVPKGTYFVKIAVDGKNITKRIVVM